MSLLEYKCPCCAGAIKYDGTIDKMKCPFCDSEFEVESLKSLDEEINNEVTENLEWEKYQGEEWAGENGTKSYECKSCGAQIVTESTTTASSCPYCGNPIVMMQGFAGNLKPDFVIPFKLDKKAAKEGFKKHLEDKKLLPPVFKTENHIDEIQGVYVPFWIFDSDAQASLRYKASKVRHYTSGRYDCTETSYYSCLRSGSIAFENVPVDGSQKMDDDLMDSIEPYNFSDSVDFQTAYLAGYLADKYDVSAEDSIDRANIRIRKSTIDVFGSTVTGYTSVVNESSLINLHNGRTRYALLPVWILRTTWNNQNFIFAMNGQTGKFVGNLPCDKGLLRKYRLRAAGIVSAITFAVSALVYFFM